MMKFKEGDKVKLKITSEYYGKSKSNPANVEGTIDLIYGEDYDVDIHVDWDNGTHNSCYTYKDLELSSKEVNYEIY